MYIDATTNASLFSFVNVVFEESFLLARLCSAIFNGLDPLLLFRWVPNMVLWLDITGGSPFMKKRNVLGFKNGETFGPIRAIDECELLPIHVRECHFLAQGELFFELKFRRGCCRQFLRRDSSTN
jgi:hypothetical protein